MGERVSVPIRFPDDVHEKLRQAAEDRGVSMNWLTNRAVRDFLDRLRTADELLDSLTENPHD